MRLNKGTKKAFSLALSAALVITGVNIGTAKSKAADVTANSSNGYYYINGPITPSSGNGSELYKTNMTKEMLSDKDGKTDSVFGNEWGATVSFSNSVLSDMKDPVVVVKGKNLDVKIDTTDSGYSYNEYGYGILKDGITKTADIDEKSDLEAKLSDGISKDGGVLSIKFNNEFVTYDNDSKSWKELKLPQKYSFRVQSKADQSNGWKAFTDAQIDYVKIYDGATYKYDAATGDVTAKAEETPEPTATAAAATTPAVTAAPEPTVEPTVEPTAEPTPEPTEAPKGKMGDFNVKLSLVCDDSWGEQTWGDISTHVTNDGDYKIEYTAQNDSTGLYLMILDTDLYQGSLSDDFKFTVKSVQIGDKTIKVDDNGCWGFADQNEANNYRFNVVNPWNGLFDSTGVKWQDEKVTSMDKLNKPTFKAGDKIVVNFNVTTKKAAATSKAKVTVGKKKVTVKAGKSVNVSYKALDKAGKSVKATASSANKKVAKVTVSSKKQIKITVPKTAKAGASTKVTVKSAGKKAVITVKVAKK